MDNKARILKELLLHGEMSTGELCKALGYVGGEGIAQYSYIQNDLETLYPEYLSRSKRKTKGRPGTFYRIKDDLATYREIWSKHEDLRDVMMKVPRVQELLTKAWKNVYEFYEGTPEAEYFKSGLLIRTFFQWHIERDPPKYRIVTDSHGKRIERDPPGTTPLSPDGLMEWGRLSGEVPPPFTTPHKPLWEFIRKAAFYDFLEDSLTEEEKGVLERLHSKEIEVKSATETGTMVAKVFYSLQGLKNALENKELKPLFTDEMAKDLKNPVEESISELYPHLKQKDLTVQEWDQTLRQIRDRFILIHPLFRHLF